MIPDPAYNNFLGPYGLTIFLLFIVFGCGGVLAYAGKLVLDTYSVRLAKIEAALLEKSIEVASLNKQLVDLSEKCGEMRGKLEVLGAIDSTVIAKAIAEKLRTAVA